MSLFKNNKLSEALKDYKFTDSDTTAPVEFSGDFEAKMGRFIRQKQRGHNIRVFSQRAAAAVVTVAIFGSFFYLLLLPRNSEGSLPFDAAEERPLQIEEAEPPTDPAPTPAEISDVAEDPCECCPECDQEECDCSECVDSDDCICSEPEPEPETLPLPGDTADIEVATVEELLKAISPNTHITLNAGLYDVSELAGFESPYIIWQNDGYGLNEKTLVITGVENLTLEAAPGAEVEIVTPYRNAEVLAFSNSRYINLIGIKAGHTVTGDYECDAGVVSFENCSNIFVDDCYFYGCGSVGITMTDCNTALIRDTIITDCSRAALIIDESNLIEFLNCKFIDNRAYQYVICILDSLVRFNHCEISGNKFLAGSVIEIDYFGGNSNVEFFGCYIRDNAPVFYPGFDIGNIFQTVSESNRIYRGIPYIGIISSVIELGEFSLLWNDNEVSDLGGNVLQ